MKKYFSVGHINLYDFDIGLFSGDVLGYKGRPYSAAGGVAGQFPFDGKIAWR